MVAETIHPASPVVRVVTADARWAGLYRAGAVAGLATVALTAVAVVAYVAWPPPAWSPGAAGDWFSRFHENPLLGLLGLDLVVAVCLVLGVPFFLALYVSLRRDGEAAVLVAVALALLGTVLHLVSNTAFEVLSLSEGYAAATTEGQRAVFLAAGEASLAAYYGTAFHISYIVGYAAKILIGAVMLRSLVFGRATAYLGIVAGVLGLGLYLPNVGLLLSVLSVLFVAAWSALVARALLRLAAEGDGRKGQ